MKIIRKQLKEILNNSTTDYVSNLRRKILLDYLEYNDGSDNLQVLLNIIDIADIKQLSGLSFFLRSKERMFRLALPNLNEKSLKKIFLEINDVNFKLNKKNIYIWSNSKLINKWIKKNKFIFCDFYNKLPEILSSNNYLSPKGPKVFYIGNKRFIVNSLRDIGCIKSNFIKLSELIKNVSGFMLPKHVAFYKQGDSSYLITSWEGKTIEDEIKECVNKIKVTDLIKKAIILKDIMIKKGIFWYSMAPRNLIFQNDIIVLIDFEKVFYENELTPEKKHYYELFTKIWFADICKNTDFFENKTAGYNYCLSDEFEKKWYKKNKISKKERLDLFRVTEKIERYHLKYGVIVYGHSIGQYLSDYCKLEVEKYIYNIVEKINNKDLFYFVWFLEQCICVEYVNIVFKNDFSQRLLTKEKIKCFNANNIKIAIDFIKYLFLISKNTSLDIYQRHGFLVSAFNCLDCIKSELLTDGECKKIILLKINNLSKYKVIVEKSMSFDVQRKEAIKKYYRESLNNVLKIIGHKKGVFIVLTGSYAHDNMNILSDLDGYYFSNNTKKAKLMIKKYKLALKCFGIFLNENFNPIVNQFFRYKILINEASKQSLKINYAFYKWTETTEKKSINIYEKNNKLLYSPSLFLKFYKRIVIEYINNTPLNKRLLPIEEIYGYFFEFLYGDKIAYNNFNDKILSITQNYQNNLLHSKYLKNQIRKFKNKNKLRLTNVKLYYIPMYLCLYSLYWSGSIDSPSVLNSKKIQSFSELISLILLKSAMKDQKYLYYCYTFNRQTQKDLKKILMTDEDLNDKLYKLYFEMMLLT